MSYVLMLSTNLENWICIPVGENGSWLDTNSGGYTTKFYRVREQ